MRVGVHGTGLQYLLDNQLALPVMKAVLSHLGNMIHDTSERVRCAFVDLLLKVKGAFSMGNTRSVLLRCKL